MAAERARGEIPQPKPLDLNVLLVDMQPMLRSLVNEEIELLLPLATALPSIEADPIHMRGKRKRNRIRTVSVWGC